MVVDTCLTRRFLDRRSERPPPSSSSTTDKGGVTDGDEHPQQQQEFDDDADDAAMRGKGGGGGGGGGGGEREKGRGEGRRPGLTPFRPQHLTDLIEVGWFVDGVGGVGWCGCACGCVWTARPSQNQESNPQPKNTTNTHRPHPINPKSHNTHNKHRAWPSCTRRPRGSSTRASPFSTPLSRCVFWKKKKKKGVCLCVWRVCRDEGGRGGRLIDQYIAREREGGCWDVVDRLID